MASIISWCLVVIHANLAATIELGTRADARSTSARRLRHESEAADCACAEANAEIEALKSENQRLRAQLAELNADTQKAPPSATALGGAVHLSAQKALGSAAHFGAQKSGGGAAAHGNRTAAARRLYPARSMPVPLPGEKFVVELNMPTVPGALGYTIVPGSNTWGTPMAKSTVTVDNGKVLSVDDVVFGYNRLWQDLGLWEMQRWKGVRFFQAPQDALAIQQLIWTEQPDLLIEIGTHAGGSAVMFSDIMTSYNPAAQIVTMDPDNTNIEPNSVFWSMKNIKYLQGYSVDPNIFNVCRTAAMGAKKTMVIQDADHSAAAVHSDLLLYDQLVSVGSYMVVQDTSLDRTAPGPINGALEAVRQFLKPGGQGYGRYGVDKAYEYLLFSTNHNGYLKKVRQ